MIVGLAIAALAAGCGDDESDAPRTAEPSHPAGSVEKRQPVAHCPSDLAGCRTATGRILYVERVDPDGDGDAHFVLASREGITARGISVIDVRRDLRPHPLPGPGSRLSAAGLVQTGSYGQRQIEAVRVRVAR